MPFRISSLVNVGIFTLLIILIGGFQTAFWYQLFGSVSAPLIWLNVIIYLILYRRPFPTIFTVYFFGLILCAFTAMPMKMMFFSLLFFFMFVYFFKTRVFWGGAGYYTMMCSGGALAYHLIYISLSSTLESNTVSIDIVDRLIQILVTPIFSFPIYQIMKKVDYLTLDPIDRETGGYEV